LDLVDVFDVAVLVQPFFFLYLYRVRAKVSMEAFYLLGCLTAFNLWVLDVNIGHFDNFLLVLYTVMVLATVVYYRHLDGLKPICFGFLLVWINSYLWEFPLHVLDFISNRDVALQLVQALKIAPLPFLIYLAVGDIDHFNLKWAEKACLYLWVITLGTAVLQKTVINQTALQSDLIYTIPRLLGLYVMWRIFKPLQPLNSPADCVAEESRKPSDEPVEEVLNQLDDGLGVAPK
jgi:hypothetical protein